MKRIYNKLVRDRIPEIIKSDGNSAKTKILTDGEYIAELDKKLIEEMNEYLESGSLEELADLSEVIRAVTLARGHSLEQLENLCTDKAEKRGGFEKKIFLIEVNEK